MKTYTSIVSLLIFFLTLAFISCGKKWKKPTDVSFSFQFDNTSASNSVVNFTSGQMVLGKLLFEGNRKQGQNHIEVEKIMDVPQYISLSQNYSAGTAFNLSIPQGTYDEINIDLDLQKQTNNPSVSFSGYYVSTFWWWFSDTATIVFSFPADAKIEIKAQSVSGSSQIVLIEDKPSKAKVILDPYYWFEPISKTMLDSATVNHSMWWQPTIYINDTSNTDIYNVVISRLHQGNKVIFE